MHILKFLTGLAGIIPPVLSTSFVTTQYLKEHFPPIEEITYEIGVRIIHDGEEVEGIGWTGHHIETLKNKDLTQLPLYYGDKETAQGYGILNGRENAAIGFIVAKRHPGHAPQRFEGPHAPLCPIGMKETSAKVIAIEPVTKNNRLGMGGYIDRAMDYYSKNTKSTKK